MNDRGPTTRGSLSRAVLRLVKFGASGLVVGALAGSAAALYAYVGYGRLSLADVGGQITSAEIGLVAFLVGLVGTAGGLVTRNERDTIHGFLVTAVLALVAAAMVVRHYSVVPLWPLFYGVVGLGLGFVTGKGTANRIVLALVGAGAGLVAYAGGLVLLAVVAFLGDPKQMSEPGGALALVGALGATLGFLAWGAVGAALPILRARPAATERGG